MRALLATISFALLTSTALAAPVEVVQHRLARRRVAQQLLVAARTVPRESRNRPLCRTRGRAAAELIALPTRA